MTARKFGDKRHARPLDPLFDRLGLLRQKIERGGAVNRLAGIAGGQNRQRAEPLARQHHHGVDVLALGQGPISVDGRGAKIVGRDFGPQGHRLANRSHLEPIAQGPQCRTMAILPDVS